MEDAHLLGGIVPKRDDSGKSSGVDLRGEQ
jgi:hypothetical protein